MLCSEHGSRSPHRPTSIQREHQARNRSDGVNLQVPVSPRTVVTHKTHQGAVHATAPGARGDSPAVPQYFTIEPEPATAARDHNDVFGDIGPLIQRASMENANLFRESRTETSKRIVGGADARGEDEERAGG
jgi:hypothetical protein